MNQHIPTFPKSGSTLDDRGTSSEQLTRGMTALQPLIEAHAPETERLRRISDPVWSALRESGFFRQLVPTEFGGMATDVDSFVDASLPIAEVCASTAWVATFNAKYNWAIAHFPPETQAELWGGAPHSITASAVNTPPGRATRVSGGVRVTGAWKWGTGIMHADWVIAGALLAEDGAPPRMLLSIFPATEAEILDTWHADGMAGTGSHDIRVADLFVPDAKTVDFASVMDGRGPGSRHYAEAIFSAPAVAFFAMTTALPVLGAARGAMRHFRERLAGRTQPGASITQAERPTAQIRLAEADLMISTAELLIRDAGRRAVAAGALDRAEQLSERIAVRAQSTHAVGLCRNAALHLAQGAGASAHMLDQPFQRMVRDINFMSSHFGFDVDVSYEQHGRALPRPAAKQPDDLNMKISGTRPTDTTMETAMSVSNQRTRPPGQGDTVDASGPRSMAFSQSPAIGNSRAYMGSVLSIPIDGACTDGRLAVIEGWSKPGNEPPPHIHVWEDEVFRVVDGSVEFYCGNDPFIVGPGAYAFIPQGTPHAFRILTPVVQLIIIASQTGQRPVGLDRYFVAMSEPALSMELPADATTYATNHDPAAAIALGAEYGVRFLTPLETTAMLPGYPGFGTHDIGAAGRA